MSGPSKRTVFVACAASLLAGCISVSDRSQTTSPAVPPAPAAVPAGYQYLYGSGEGAAMALTAYHALIAYVTDKTGHRPVDSVVLTPNATLPNPIFFPCGDKPLAVIFDVDETLIYNLGFEARAAAGEPYDPARWARYEETGQASVVAVPGAGPALGELRKLGVTPILNTNRSAANADGTVAALAQAKLGDFRHGETLFLKGDDAGGAGKDGRRAKIAARYCVIAMAGDQLGDFSDLFAPLGVAERRALSVHGSAAGLWGKGWFLLPNPVYGTALKGGIDEVFPTDQRWVDPVSPRP